MSARSVSRETIAALTSAQQLQIERVLRALEADEHAPTTIREPQQASQAHIADSLSALELEPLIKARRLADLGSGAGFPGVALAVALPEAEISLIESQRRKCEFLERLCAAAGIENARVVCARAEDWSAGLGANDVVLARALAPQAVVLEYAAPLLRTGGALIDWRGRRDEAAERQADQAAAALGLMREEVRRVVPFEGASDHHLHVFTKVHETPPRFPRRAGIARKRPLGS
jgi:16S rRNA (guanine527-N7)-methyltransferase